MSKDYLFEIRMALADLLDSEPMEQKKFGGYMECWQQVYELVQKVDNKRFEDKMAEINKK